MEISKEWDHACSILCSVFFKVTYTWCSFMYRLQKNAEAGKRGCFWDRTEGLGSGCGILVTARSLVLLT